MSMPSLQDRDVSGPAAVARPVARDVWHRQARDVLVSACGARKSIRESEVNARANFASSAEYPVSKCRPSSFRERQSGNAHAFLSVRVEKV